jgi:hypothetical protein
VLGQLLVIYWAPMQAVFQTEALSLEDLGACVCMCERFSKSSSFKGGHTNKFFESSLSVHLCVHLQLAIVPFQIFLR